MVERVGSELKTEREAKGLSLTDVRGTLGIPVHYLQAMEDGASPLVADELYMVPFLRRYAEFLGKDPPHTVARYLSDVGREGAAAMVREEPPAVPQTWLIGGLVVVIAVGVLGWFALL